MLRLEKSVKVSLCSSDISCFTHRAGCLLYPPQIVSPAQPPISELDLCLIDWYLHQLCRVAKPERYGESSGGFSYD